MKMVQTKTSCVYTNFANLCWRTVDYGSALSYTADMHNMKTLVILINRYFERCEIRKW